MRDSRQDEHQTGEQEGAWPADEAGHDAHASGDEPIVVTRRVLEREQQPDLQLVDSCMLKAGPRVRKVAEHWVIVDRNTGAVRHHKITIKTYRRAGDSWPVESERSISLDNQQGDEIGALRAFLSALEHPSLPQVTGDYLIVPLGRSREDGAALARAFANLSSEAGGSALARGVLQLAADPDALEAFAHVAADDPEEARLTVAAINVVIFRRALDELRRLIETGANEAAFQRLLEQHDWMFGTEYSELLDRRHWTRDQQQDFVLRRTVDGYIEVVEINTALGGQPLFVRDPSRDVLFPRRELSAALGQVLSYIEELEADRDSILRRDGEDVHKVRAKVIIGRDGAREQVEALRRLNGHLHRVEILTFDQLLRVAERVLECLARDMRHAVGGAQSGAVD